jgi:hypothetical protein
MLVVGLSIMGVIFMWFYDVSHPFVSDRRFAVLVSAHIFVSFGFFFVAIWGCIAGCAGVAIWRDEV